MDTPKEFVGVAGKDNKDFIHLISIGAHKCIRCDGDTEGFLSVAAKIFPFCNACLYLVKTKIELYLDR